MILVGVNPPNQIEQRWLNDLAMDDSVVVFTETTSNLHHKDFFASIDKMIAPLTDEEFKQLQPDILITFGGLIISKKVKAFLRQYQPKQHWHIDDNKANNTFFCLEKHIEVHPNIFFTDFLPKITHFVKSDYKTYWESIKQMRNKKHDEFTKDAVFSDFKVFDTLLKSLPNDSILQVGNSSAVRYVQLFDVNPSVEVFCNRGTSGIDGSTSTAIGCATVRDKQTILVTGDLSFFYDSNALWNNYIPKNFRIVVINNGGGGIFRILPGHKNTDNFDYYFETKHELSAKQLSKMYNFEYSQTDSDKQLKLKLKTFFAESDTPKLLEIFTPRLINDEELLNYFNAIK